MSYTPLFDPTPWGNAFQIRFGRGFGFSTQSANVRHTALMSKTEYRNVLPSLIGSNKIITDEIIDQAIISPKLNASFTYAQIQALKN